MATWYKNDAKESDEGVHELATMAAPEVALGTLCTLFAAAPSSLPPSSSRTSTNSLWRTGASSGEGSDGCSTVEASGTLLEVRSLWVPSSSPFQDFFDERSSHFQGDMPPSQRDTSTTAVPGSLTEVETSCLNVQKERKEYHCSTTLSPPVRWIPENKITTVEREHERCGPAVRYEGAPPYQQVIQEKWKQSPEELPPSLHRCGAAAAATERTVVSCEIDDEEEPNQKKREKAQPEDVTGTGKSTILHSSSCHSASSGIPAESASEPSLKPPRSLRDILQASRAEREKRLPPSRLYGFVRVKDADHRLSGWYPLHRIGLKLPTSSSSCSSFNGFVTGTHSPPSPTLQAFPPPTPTTTHHVSSSSFSTFSSLPSSVDHDGDPSEVNKHGIASSTPAAPATTPFRRLTSTTTSRHSLCSSIRASEVLHRPLLSSIYSEVTPGMARTVRAEHLLEYFDERLLRDGRTPTTIRYFIYAQQFVFPPWYYAPYGLLHPEYDPMRLLPSSSLEAVRSSLLHDPRPLSKEETNKSTQEEVVGKEEEKKGWGRCVAPMANTPDERWGASEQSPSCTGTPSLGSSCDSSRQTATDRTTTATRNPYIRDAYLCPFSLRIYSTLQQMQYEIQQYRSGSGAMRFSSKSSSSASLTATTTTSSFLLRPPGLKIYEDLDRGIAVFEVNGSQHVTYCRHLFLLGKSFLEKKLAGHDVHNYYFFVVCLHPRYFPRFQFHRSQESSSLEQSKISTAKEEGGEHSIQTNLGRKKDEDDIWFFAGYFSWEKQVEVCNLACIVTLPCFGMSQAHPSSLSSSSVDKKDCGDTVKESSFSSFPFPRIPKGIGQFMIRLSYELAYRRGHYNGTPERPLSDLGELAYLHYWGTLLLEWWYHHLPSEEERPPSQERTDEVLLSSDTNRLLKGGKAKWYTVAVVSASQREKFRTRREGHGRKSLRGARQGIQEDPTEKKRLLHKRREIEERARYPRRLCRRLEGDAKTSFHRDESGREVVMVEEEDTLEEHEEKVSSREGSIASVMEVEEDREEGQCPCTSTRRVKPLVRQQYSLNDIAKELGLEVNDTRRAVMRKGLLQWSADERAAKWVLPKEFIKKEHEKFIQRRMPTSDPNSADYYAAFFPRLLAAKGLSYQTPPHYWDDKDPQWYF